MGGGSAAPPFGSSDPDPPVDPSDSNHVLNHYGCAIDEPFVLAIDPGGRSGAIRGWLESTASVWFDEHDLPRFGIQGAPDDDPDGELGLWWSIHDLDEGSVWMYGANRATEVAHVRVRRAAEIGDASTLSYAGTIGPVAVGEVAVFHHIPSDRYLAVQIGQLYQADESFERDLCTAIDARWVFAAPGTARFSRTR